MNKHTNISFPAKIIIGKDVLELLSSSMYVDPLTIFREYVQNAADSIDVAKAEGLLSKEEPGRVDITLDPAATTRSLIIRDNGAGVPNGEFAKRLTAIGGSLKRGTSARGFRGVGRLAGLGYCQELVFRSRTVGDSVVQELRWDCRVFKKLLSDHSYQGNLYELIQDVASVDELPHDGWPEHFYEVELVKPVRIKNDLLLNREAISHYLSQVAPVPFSPEFRHGEKIKAQLSEHIELGEIEIYVDGAEQPLYRPYRNDYACNESRRDRFMELEFREIEGRNGGVCAIVWLLHHGYHGAIPGSEGINGLRARKGNIQVGGSRIFSEIFPEPRFASWTVGEVHILDEKVVPNGRRDNFEQNAHHSHLLSRLLEVGEHISRMCRSNSKVRNRIKAFDFAELTIVEHLKILEQGAIGNAAAETITKEIRSKMHEIRKLTESSVLGEADRAALSKRYAVLDDRIATAEKMAEVSDVLTQLPEGEQAIVQRMITLIYECSANRIAAKLLVDRILARLG